MKTDTLTTKPETPAGLSSSVLLAAFEVKISDKYGLWGSVRLNAEDAAAACALAREYISEMVRLGDTDADLDSLAFGTNECVIPECPVHHGGNAPYCATAANATR